MGIRLGRDGKEYAVDYDRTNHAQAPSLGRFLLFQP